MRLALILACAAALHGTEMTWNGQARAGAWDDAANWSPVAPGPTDIANIPAGVTVTIRKTVRCAGLAGAGTVEVAATGDLRLGDSPRWSGRLQVGGAVRLDGVLGPEGTATAQLAGGTLSLAADQPRRSVQSGTGGRICALDEGRVLGGLQGKVEAPLGLVGTYLPRSRRDQPVVDEWRDASTTGTVRTDAVINFRSSGFGNGAFRRTAGISGADNDWNDFSVQWDGWIRIATPGTRLATASDDGSRVWIDRNGDGSCQSSEWGSNGWGQGQGTTTRQVQPALDPGIYRIRVQYEDGNGGNAMMLLWSDARNQAGGWDGWHVVPTSALLGRSPVRLGGTGLTLSTAPGCDLSWEGPGPLMLAAGLSPRTVLVVAAGSAQVPEGGTDSCQVTVAAGAFLELAGAQAPAGLAGTGTVVLAEAQVVLAVPAAQAVAIPTFAGRGQLTNSGPGMLVMPAAEAGIIRDIRGGPIQIDRTVSLELVHSAPLAARVLIPSSIADYRRVSLKLSIPSGGPLGIGAWAGDAHGAWFQRLVPGMLAPGDHTLTIDLDGQAVGEPLPSRFTRADAAVCPRTGLVLWSADPVPRSIRIEATVAELPTPAATEHRLGVVQVDGALRTGERWNLRFVPAPLPVDPFDPEAFTAVLVVTEPGGGERRINAFWEEPQALRDSGDREDALRTGPGAFAVRYRPQAPGDHRLRLEATWAGGAAVAWDLGTRVATGEPFAAFAQRDAQDPRFLSVGGRWWWPVGLNVRSTYDLRSRDRLGTTVGWNRGSAFYGEALGRLAAAGGDAAEVWLAGWNLGLEWNAGWKGFGGVGRYNQENAARLDRVLDAAWDRGMRLNLVVANHGQGSSTSDAEWNLSPYNRCNGGWLDHPGALFREARALAAQDRYRRYLAARYSDHPALMGWKLWSEVQLTAAGDATRAWHEQAGASWARHDPWHRPLTTHWADNWRAVDAAVATLPVIDYVTIDAYRGEGAAASLLADSLLRPAWAKGRPVVVTEYGGHWNACPEPRMRADLASGAWAGLVSGHAGAPMLWWHEWVAQRGGWESFGAIRRFIRGEDLRGSAARSAALTVSGGAGLWCRAWVRPGRILGYACDLGWGTDGGEGNEQRAVLIRVGEDVAAGHVSLEWWDADSGTVLSTSEFTHSGGALTLPAPTFRRHIAFKLVRDAAK
jgi:hypothetical protein